MPAHFFAVFSDEERANKQSNITVGNVENR